jgi:calcium-dependent protein kinase
MGIIFNYSKNDYEEPKNTKEEICNKKGPSFFLNKEFPNYKKIPLEEVLNNLLKSKYDLLENNELTSSISKQFKLLYKQNSNSSKDIKNIKLNENEIITSNEKYINDFSFSQVKPDEEINSENNFDIKEGDNTNNKNIIDIQSALINTNTKNTKNEIFNEINNGIKNSKKNFFLSDYNIYSSAKNSQNHLEENDEYNIGINNQEKNKINKKILELEKEQEKKSSKSFTNKIKEAKPHVKFRKFTETETNITKAASLLKDIRKEYRFKNQLGGGHFGTVRKAYRISEKNNIVKFYAIKSIPMKNLSCNIDDFIKEVDIISTLDHPNIIKFYETYHDDCFFHIVMELCKGKEIVNQMGNYGFIEEKKVTNIIFKVLLAIVHCHNRGVTHRDLKPENILFDSMKKDAEIKLIDFGLSRKYDKEQKMHSILGTPYYVAPEVLKGEYDEKCDIWSIGAMTYLMLCGEPPFNGNSNNEIFKKIVKENIKFKSYMWKNISNSAKDFVKICLNKNSTKRPSASEALNHPWFSNVIKDTHNVKKIKKEILLNIKNFNISYQFKLMVLKYLVDNKLSHEEKQIFKASFYALDFNHNGFIIEQDLIKAFKLFNIDIDEERIEHLFNILPDNKNLGLGFSEFIMAGIDKKLILTEKNLEDAFNYFDINKTGDIEFDNLNSALLRNGKRYVNSNDINTIIDEVMKDVKKNKGNDAGDIDNNKEEDDCPKISKEDFMEIFKEF